MGQIEIFQLDVNTRPMLEKNLKKNLAENLIRMRAERGLTQEELVLALKEEQLDISRTALASYENQRSFPKLDVLYVISRFFNTDIEQLLSEKTASGNVLDKNFVDAFDLNEILQDFSEVLSYFKKYRGMYFALVEKLLQTFSQSETRDELLKLFATIDANADLQLPKLRDQYRKVLDHREILVFQGVSNGVPIEELALELHTDPKTIAGIFMCAQEKVFNLWIAD